MTFLYYYFFLQTPLRLPVLTKKADDFSHYHLITEAKKQKMLTLNENRCKVRSVFVNNIYEAENQYLSLLHIFTFTLIQTYERAVVVVIVWQLDSQLPMQSVPITTKVVSSNPIHGKVYSIQHYVINFIQIKMLSF